MTKHTTRAEHWGGVARDAIHLAQLHGDVDGDLRDETVYEAVVKAAHYAARTLPPVPARIRIVVDQDATSPRDGTTNLGIMWCPNRRRYTLGDEDADSPYLDWDADARRLTEGGKLRPDVVVCLPLGLIDHSGISMYVGGGAHPCDPGGWDSGTVGFIYATRATIAECMGDGWRVTPKRHAELERQLRAEVEVYDQYLRGDVYGFIVEDHDGEQLDSCWGFYGDDWKTNGMAEHWDDETRRIAEREGVGETEY